MIRAHVAVILACGCGEVSGPPKATDASVDAGADAEVDAEPTDAAPLGPWSIPVRIAELSTSYSDAHPAIRADGRELIFNSNRDGNGNSDLWVSTRGSITDPWMPPRHVTELDATATTESGPALSADGTTIYFARAYASGTTGFDLYTARRNTTSDAWGVPMELAELNTAGHERSPHLSSDGTSLWYVIHDGAQYDIWVASRAIAAGAWSTAHEVPRLTSTSDDDGPSATGDELTMYFDSTMDGSQQVYATTRMPAGPWSMPVPVPELAGGQWVTVMPSDRYMVLTMVGPDGSFDLYESRR